MKYRQDIITLAVGLLGALIISFGIVVSNIYFIGCSDQNYSILNHFISELGQYQCSEKAFLFNICLIIGTPFLIYYYLKILPESVKKIKNIFTIIIVLIGVSAICIGMFSMDKIVMHIISAIIFFYLCFFASLAFNIYALFFDKKNIPKYFVMSSILMSVSLLANIIEFQQLDQNMLETLKDRPNILLVCVLEWLSLATMLLFFICSQIFFYKKSIASQK
tara:strand:- start:172 stop:831 length:660 start_codon:yes stop_codon:yes gene_type:complete